MAWFAAIILACIAVIQLFAIYLLVNRLSMKVLEKEEQRTDTLFTNYLNLLGDSYQNNGTSTNRLLRRTDEVEKMIEELNT